MTFKSGVATYAWMHRSLQDGELITGLTAQDFVVREDDRPQPIVYFGREKEPLRLLAVLDVSGSMRKYVEQVATVARQAFAVSASQRSRCSDGLCARRLCAD